MMDNMNIRYPTSKIDDSKYEPEFGITRHGELICLVEYATQIAHSNSTQVILLTDS